MMDEKIGSIVKISGIIQNIDCNNMQNLGWNVKMKIAIIKSKSKNKNKGYS